MGIADKVKQLVATAAALAALAGPATTAYAQQQKGPDCSDKSVQEQIFSSRLNRSHYWTTEELMIKVLKAGKLSIIHWREEGKEINSYGDRFMCDLIRLYGTSVEQFFIINVNNYPNQARELRSLVAPISRDAKEGIIYAWPSYSIIYRDNTEERIRGPPIKGGYEHRLQEYRKELDQRLQ